MLKFDTLLKNKNNVDKIIWIQLPTTVEKIQEAISDFTEESLEDCEHFKSKNK